MAKHKKSSPKTNIPKKTDIPITPAPAVSNNAETKERPYNFISFWLPIIGILISSGSLFVAFNAYNKASKNFTLVNQGYLQADVVSEVVKAGFDKLLPPGQIPDSGYFDGINVGLKFKNVGNIPIKYNVLKFDVLIDSIISTKPMTDENNLGLLYPKQELMFFIPTTSFKQIERINNVKQKRIELTFYIEYSDFGETRIKTIDRDAIIIIHDNITEIGIKKVRDKI